MNFTNILIAIAVLGAMGAIFGAALAFAERERMIRRRKRQNGGAVLFALRKAVADPVRENRRAAYGNAVKQSAGLGAFAVYKQRRAFIKFRRRRYDLGLVLGLRLGRRGDRTRGTACA